MATDVTDAAAVRLDGGGHRAQVAGRAWAARSKRGAPLVEIETDKANMTYEADTDGVLLEIVAGEGDTLEVGEVIARIGEPRARTPASRRRRSRRRTAGGRPSRAGAAAEPGAPRPRRPEPPAAPGNGGERIKASPVARRMAGELGVELAALEGSGPAGGS